MRTNFSTNNKSISRIFIISAVLSSLILVLGEQAIIVLWSPVYFTNLGELIWNLFVSISFLVSIATLYGLLGGVCFQAVADHVDPLGHLLKVLKKSRTQKSADIDAFRTATGLIVASGTYAVILFLAQIHCSTAYTNKKLAALLFLAMAVFLIPPVIVVFASIKRLMLPAATMLERIFTNKLLLIELVSIIVLNLTLIIGFFALNQYIFEAIDFRPIAIIAIFFVMQAGIYYLLKQPAGSTAVKSLSSVFTLGGLLLNLSVMLTIVIIAYPSQANVASILRNYAPFSKQVIIGLQTLVDKDGDGFSPILRGGDCNDSNMFVHPMAQEIPENGLDDDCFGGDSKVIHKKQVVLDELTKIRLASLRQKYNIILISIDALRGDHLGFMGYGRNTSPEIDDLAANSTVFTRAYSQAPNTPQSIPSFITGMYPSQISWQKYTNFPKINSSTSTVMDLLKNHGYHVAGIFSHWFFEKRNLSRDADWWDTRAFRQRDHSERVSTDDLVTTNAIEHLEKIEGVDKPLFMWLHYFDPHFLYVKHENANFGNTQLDLYDGEIRNNGIEVARFLKYFKQSEWYENSIIFIFADHGEEFEEHGKKWHGSQLYEESIHVPLIIHSPAISAVGQIKTPVSLVDIVPTIYDIVGIKKNNKLAAKAQGLSLFPYLINANIKEVRPVFVEKLKAPTFPWSVQALITKRWKIIHRANEQIYELYDLETDPKEQRNLFELLPEKAIEMQLMLSEFRQTNLNQDSGWYQLANKKVK